MKKINQCKFIAAAFAVLALASCNYEEVNTNPFEMTDKEGIMDGIAMGGLVTAMEKSVFPTGTQADDTYPVNDYQNAYNLSADSWSGYIGVNNTFEGGNCHLNYVIHDAWVKTTFAQSYTNLLDPWKKLTASAKENDTPELAALAQVLKISGWHKVLESFGPIPYTQAGKATIDVPFDSEEIVYTEMLKDLAQAVEVLTPKAISGVKVMPDYDLVFEGDAMKWVKYANSLMLRLAMRLRNVKPELAKQYVKLAVDHSVGVMTDAGDAAGAGSGAGIVLRNPIYWIADNYNDARVGTSILAYLLGYEDPRLSAYCMEANSKCTVAVPAFNGKNYQAVPLGHTHTRSNGESTEFDSYYYYSKPNIQGDTPLNWMRASEAYFLRAEAALYWGTEYGKGEAEALYKQGIETSFQENGVTGSVDAYMNSDNKPAANKVNSSKFGFDYPAPSQVTAKFEGTQEEKLEKIITQKYIALYPNGQEAWTEFRRTGYPKLNPILPGGNRNSNIDETRGMRRMSYPVSFNGTDQSHEIYQDALNKLGGQGGPDSPATDLWWAKKN